jgi:hypothetical protein
MNFNEQSRSCHAERSEGEASLCPSSQTFRCSFAAAQDKAQGDKTWQLLIVKNHYRPRTLDYEYHQSRSVIHTHCRVGSGVDAGWGRLRRPRPPCGSISAFGR